jgi:uncharacterized protein (DUF2141 family)
VRIFSCICFVLIALVSGGKAAGANQQQAASPPDLHTLTVTVEGVNHDDGNIGVLVFNAPKGWPEDRFIALKDIVVPAHPGTVTVAVPGLPAGDYAVSIAHDVNKNHKVDRNWLGIPKEQWGMSNNPHPSLKVPSFAACKFALTGDLEIHVKMQ